MAGTAVFQSNTLATPGAGIVVATDSVNGTLWQEVKLDIGPAGTSIPLSYGGTGLPLGTLPGGSIGVVGTVQMLGSVQGVGTFQVLGSVQPVGTSQALGTMQPLAGSVHLASGSVNAQGVVAHGAAVAGNPLLMSGVGSSGTQAATADGQLTRIAVDLNGRVQTGAFDGPATLTATLTRPNDTTTYAANDEVTDTGGAILTMTGAARFSGGGGFITDLVVSDSANVATKAQLVLFVYDTTSTPATDNAAFAPTDGAQNTCVAIIPINIWYPGDDTSGAGGNALGVYGGPPISFKTAASANLFVRVKVLNAYVPVAQEVFQIRMKVRRD